MVGDDAEMITKKCLNYTQGKNFYVSKMKSDSNLVRIIANWKYAWKVYGKNLSIENGLHLILDDFYSIIVEWKAPLYAKLFLQLSI